MSVSRVGSALSTLTGASAEQVQQAIAVNVLKQQMDSEAAIVAQLLESGRQIFQATSVGSRVDFRA